LIVIILITSLVSYNFPEVDHDVGKKEGYDHMGKLGNLPEAL
jgi:hypothetical protein